MKKENEFEIYGLKYVFPTKPTVVVCLDGSEPEYINFAIKKGLMPNVENMIEKGEYHIAKSAMPSFTNPNNISIATGTPPKIHGISGNYYYDPSKCEAIMMNDVKFLNTKTIFYYYQKLNAKVAIITAKDKLRSLLGADLSFEHDMAVCFSAEMADRATFTSNGISNASKWLDKPVPCVYSSDLSEFVFAAGEKLLNEFKPDIMYLSTTDYIQHKYDIEDNNALEFYQMVDKYIGKFLENNISLIITADHGMKPKHNKFGKPNIIFLQNILDHYLKEKCLKVILPITDPYVVHHGALGSFATIYFHEELDIEKISNFLKNKQGILEVLNRQEASSKFELPEDRIGDLTVISEENMTFGTSPEDHDLSLLKEPLRSHGGITEQNVPFIINKKINNTNTKSLRNFHAFHYATLASKI